MYLIETLDKSVPVEDLGLVVTAQVPVWITPDQYKASECLRRLEKIGRVRVSLKNRSRVTKEPPQRPRAQQARMSRPRVTSVTPPPVVVAEVTYSQKEVEALVEQAALRAAETVSKRLSAHPSTPTPGELEERVTRAVERALKHAPTASKPLSKGPEEPLFIPTGIVREGQSELAVQTESSGDSEGLKEASTALKKLRKKKGS